MYIPMEDDSRRRKIETVKYNEFLYFRAGFDKSGISVTFL